ncbi:MAG: acyl-CoA dehydrogenase family protein [Alphaproteobacteria bacterium]|nr:acyl-CoA dehydrogenase family protein [Alphaproteobacteria bacterium]MDE2013772.1 acyl-CoA dehydrogenase family protein [Alphaproteobacteria bacterium]MDE2075437.1 acyl-CoA dehydrogenase family protein [Alphaproteobacteria bacterium]
MDFAFSEEQTLLQNSVSKFLADHYDFEAFKKISRSEAGWSREVWAQLAELGLMAAPLPEEYGGLGGGPVETMIVMEEFGRALVVEPFASTVVVGGGFIQNGGSEAMKQEWLGKIAGGEAVIAFAFAEPKGRYNFADLATTAKKNGGGYVLNGMKAVVLGGPMADTLIVTARTAGGQREEKGVSVFLVDKNAKGVSARDYPTIDGLRASEISFENVEIPAGNLIGMADDGLALIERVTDAAIAAHASEAVGAMKVLLAATVEYTKTRKQFGVPIGKFQVLQHRMVDMFMNAEQSASVALMATLKLGEADVERKKAASAAKVQIGKAGRFVGQQAVQLHGGMGMTDELNVGHYFKRLTMLDTLYGNVDHHLKRYAALS